jgi:hypothetical protein
MFHLEADHPQEFQYKRLKNKVKMQITLRDLTNDVKNALQATCNPLCCVE